MGTGSIIITKFDCNSISDNHGHSLRPDPDETRPLCGALQFSNVQAADKKNHPELVLLNRPFLHSHFPNSIYPQAPFFPPIKHSSSWISFLTVAHHNS